MGAQGPATHRRLDRRLCGAPVRWGGGRGQASMRATEAMAADEQGLVHGGFVFGLADHAAMLAVDHPYVVLTGAQVRFTAPVRVGEEVVAEAVVVERQGRKVTLEVEARVGDRVVLQGRMTAAVLDRHVLERSAEG